MLNLSSCPFIFIIVLAAATGVRRTVVAEGKSALEIMPPVDENTKRTSDWVDEENNNITKSDWVEENKGGVARDYVGTTSGSHEVEQELRDRVARAAPSVAVGDERPLLTPSRTATPDSSTVPSRAGSPDSSALCSRAATKDSCSEDGGTMMTLAETRHQEPDDQRKARKESDDKKRKHNVEREKACEAESNALLPVDEDDQKLMFHLAPKTILQRWMKNNMLRVNDPEFQFLQSYYERLATGFIAVSCLVMLAVGISSSFQGVDEDLVLMASRRLALQTDHIKSVDGGKVRRLHIDSGENETGTESLTRMWINSMTHPHDPIMFVCGWVLALLFCLCMPCGCALGCWEICVPDRLSILNCVYALWLSMLDCSWGPWRRQYPPRPPSPVADDRGSCTFPVSMMSDNNIAPTRMGTSQQLQELSTASSSMRGGMAAPESRMTARNLWLHQRQLESDQRNLVASSDASDQREGLRQGDEDTWYDGDGHYATQRQHQLVGTMDQGVQVVPPTFFNVAGSVITAGVPVGGQINNNIIDLSSPSSTPSGVITFMRGDPRETPGSSSQDYTNKQDNKNTENYSGDNSGRSVAPDSSWQRWRRQLATDNNCVVGRPPGTQEGATSSAGTSSRAGEITQRHQSTHNEELTI